MKLVFLLLLLPLVVFSQGTIHEPDGLRMPGTWNGWDNDVDMTGDFTLEKINAGTPRWQTQFLHEDDTTEESFKFVSTSFGDPWGNQWAGNDNMSINTLEPLVYGTPSNPDNHITLNQNHWYTVVFQDNGYANSQVIFMETEAQPVSILNVSRDPFLVEANQAVNVTADLSADASAQEYFFIRYTYDHWATSHTIPLIGNDTSLTGEIPAFADDTHIEYYVFSSVFEEISQDFDLLSLEKNNNMGSNYSYTVGEELNCGEESSLITTIPAFPQESLPLVMYFNAEFGNQGLLNFEGDVYAHTGVITNLSENTSDWRYVKTEWGENTEETQLTRLGANLYSLEIDDIRAYYEVEAEEDIETLVFVFRSDEPDANGGYLEHKTLDNEDILVQLYQEELTVRIISPSKREPLLNPGEAIAVCVEALESEQIELLLNEMVLATETGSSLTYPLFTQDLEAGMHWLIAKATAGTETVYDSTAIYLRGQVVVEDLPATIAELPRGEQPGIHYHEDNTSVTFVLHDPPAIKQFAFVIGDFSDWLPSDDTYMKRTPNGQYFWKTISGLESGEEYAFQHFIDGELRLACPYSEKVLDPWNDRWIPETTYPDLISYPAGKTTGIVGVIHPGREEYQWEVENFVPVAVNETQSNLIIYELLIRDFVETSSIDDVREKLDYLQNLGVNAIELMPINQFEGNDSWGYNPAFYFATDKAYGTREAYKRFIDEAHKRGIAVIIDMVLNHSFNLSPMVQMYFDPNAGEWGQPSAQNPWFLEECPGGFAAWSLCWGNTFDQNSVYVHDLFKRVTDYWLTEYKIDGFRLDFTKGFTNYPSGNFANDYNQNRIDNLMRVFNDIKSANPNAYVILEHLSDNPEEVTLANAGMLLWANMHPQFSQNTMGWENGHDFSWAYYANRGFNYPNLIPYMESHDEERLMFDNLHHANTDGGSWGLEMGLQRNAAAMVLYMTIPGPKMIWQFGELGYDYSINHCPDGTIDGDCRTARKPVRWDYWEDENRQELYWAYSAMAHLKTENAAFREGAFTQDLGGMGKRMWIEHGDMNVSVSANLHSSTTFDMQPGFQNAGTWYNYFTGESFEVSDPAEHTITYAPGDFFVFINQDISTPELRIDITAVNKSSQEVIQGVALQLGGGNFATTNDQGMAQLISLPGTYILTAEKEGYISYETEVELTENMELLIEMESLGLYSITFHVDMSPAIEDGRFDPSEDFVDVAGTFNGWAGDGPFELLEDHTFNYTTEAMFEIGDVIEFKFRVNGSWDDTTAEFPNDPDGEFNRIYEVIDGDNLYEGIYDTTEGDNGDDQTNTHVVSDTDFRVFPNPAKEVVFVQFNGQAEVMLYDSRGSIIYRQKAVNSAQFQTSDIPTGMYFVRITNDRFSEIRKVIIQK